MSSYEVLDHTEEPTEKEIIAEITVEDHEQPKYRPFVFVPILAYVLSLLWFLWRSQYHWLICHIIAVFVAYVVESIRESVVYQLDLEDGDETIVGVAMYTVPLVILVKMYEICFVAPLHLFLRSRGLEISRVEVNKVPMRRRKQTIAVTLWILMLPAVPFVYFFTFTSIFTLPLITIPYLLWMFFIDKTPRTGLRYPRFRYWKLNEHFVDFFPITLHRASKELDPSKKYVFCYHPHGIIGIGAFGAIATNACKFSEKFPGIDIRLLTLDTNFNIPFLREIILNYGICSVDRKSCDAILGRGPGSAICIVVGGAAEALETSEGTYRLVLSRKGFARVAVANQANLVPVIAFGETDAFNVLHSVQGNGKFGGQKKLGFSMPVFWGRGIGNYNVGFLPKRSPINVITGPPIEIDSDQFKGLEGEDLVSAVHQEYIVQLKRLFDEYKDRTDAGRSRVESIKIVQ